MWRQQSGGLPGRRFHSGDQTWMSALARPPASRVAVGKLRNLSGLFPVITSDPPPEASGRTLRSQGPVGAYFNRGEEV